MFHKHLQKAKQPEDQHSSTDPAKTRSSSTHNDHTAVQLIIRLTAVRGSLLDHLDEHQILYEGVPAALDFVDQICQKIKAFILGEGSGPLQNILVLVSSLRQCASLLAPIVRVALHIVSGPVILFAAWLPTAAVGPLNPLPHAPVGCIVPGQLVARRPLHRV